MSDGTLRTPGAVDFFRLLNEHVAVVEEVSRGEVLYAAACRALKVGGEGPTPWGAELLQPLHPGGVLEACATG